jgi:hypothetical protein
MKKFFTIPFFVVMVSLCTFWGYSYMDVDPTGRDHSPNSEFVKHENSYLQNLVEGGSITAYAVDVRNANVVRLNDCSRTIKTVSGGRPIYGGDFDQNGVWYAMQADSLLTIDTASGTMTYLGAITGATTGNNLGMTFDHSTNTMYFMRNLPAGSMIYTLNLTSRVATQVGLVSSSSSTNVMIEMAVSNEGDMYAWSLTDSLYSVNKSTGASTLIGPLGVNIGFAQGGDFDPATNKLIMAGYIGSGVNNLYELNLSTGAATLICAPPAGEYDAFAIAGSVAPPGGNNITVCRDGLNLTIPDNGGNANHLRDTIVVSGVPSGMEITQMTVIIDSLTHTWVGDVRVWIEKVGGPVDTVISRIGLGTGAFPGAGNSCNDFINTNLVDSATSLVQGIMDPAPGCGNGAGQIPANGYFKPKDPLAGFNGNGIDPNGTYIIHVSDNAALDFGALRSWCVSIDYDLMTNAGNNTSIVNDYQLHQNYPNPFNPTTKIRFEIPKQNFVSLKIYDISGREVAILINGERNAGAYDVEFDGSYLASGTYFYRLQAGDFVQVKKMVLLK